MKKRLEQVIAQKVEGQEITFAEAPEPQGKIIDLMEALRASLAKTGAAAPAAQGAQARRVARPAPPRGSARAPRGGAYGAGGHDLRRPRGGASCRRRAESRVRSLARAGLVEAAARPARRAALRLSRARVPAPDARPARRPQERAARAARTAAPARGAAARARPLRARSRHAAGELVVREAGPSVEPRVGAVRLRLRARLERGGAPPRRAVRDRPPIAMRTRWYRLGCELEAPIPSARAPPTSARSRSRPHHAGAHVNLGCLEHEAGRLAAAEAHYRAALAARPDDVTARFDLAVVLEDRPRFAEARELYEACLADEPRAPRRTTTSRACASARAISPRRAPPGRLSAVGQRVGVAALRNACNSHAREPGNTSGTSSAASTSPPASSSCAGSASARLLPKYV